MTQNRTTLYIALLILGLVLSGVLLTQSRLTERLDLLLYDLYLPLHAGQMSDRIVIIEIDDSSIEQIGRWPWSRRIHARLIDQLSEMKAASVGFDILFAEPDKADPEADSELARAIKKNGRVILSVAPGTQPDGMIAEILPLPELAFSAAGLGHVDTELDLDGLCRRVFLFSGLSDARWPALTLAMLNLTDQAPDFTSRPDTRNGVSEHWVRSNSMLIPFAAVEEKILKISAASLLTGLVTSDAITGKHVLIGATATGLGDVLATPAASEHQRLPGVEINAHILNSLLQQRQIQPMSVLNQLLLGGALITICSLLVCFLPLRFGILNTVSLMGVTLALPALLLKTVDIWFAPTSYLIPMSVIWPAWSLWQIAEDNRLRRKMLQQLDYQARHHRATGLPNNGMLESRIRELITHPVNAGQIGLLLIHFEWPGSASTTLGRPIDDQMLKDIGDHLKSLLNRDYFIAHLNGDDFAVLIEQAREPEEIQRIAIDLLHKLESPIEIGPEFRLLSPQIGVSIWHSDGHEEEHLLRNAYTAMFKSRLQENSHLCIYSDDVGKQLQDRSKLEQALIHALERDEFELFYQPQIDAINGRIIGVEALMRWHNPTLGWISPEIFIPVAEHVGLIRNIGLWVLQTACQQINRWHQEGLPKLRLAVNVSPIQFTSPSLDLEIESVIRQSGIDPAHLELEITEGSLMWDVDEAVRIMKMIKKRGLELAIDDFGTGYSSLSNLRLYPLDRLKIDQSFTREIGRSKNATEITLTILHMAKRLGMKIIAEGVETVEQADFLRTHGCDEFQGFLYSAPVDAVTLEQLLKQGAILSVPAPEKEKTLSINR